MTAVSSSYLLLALVMITCEDGVCLTDQVFFFRRTDYSNNSLKSIPKLQVNATYLNMRGNQIQQLQENFLSSEKLLVLQLQNNQIHSIHRNAFSLLSNLLVLQLSNNNITQLPYNIFKSNKRLNWLDLSNNQIILVNSFLASFSLRRLDLYMNELDVIPENTFELVNKVTYLSLANNKLQVVSEEAVKFLNNVMNFSLEENPLTCDCHLTGLWRWGHDKILESEHIICDSPPEMKGRSWERVSNLECSNESMEQNKYLLYGIVAFVLIISLLIVPLVIWLVRRRGAQNSSSQKPTPMPIGEYIEVLAEKEQQEHQYETVHQKEGERYISDISRESYVIPVHDDKKPEYENNEEPVYVNVRGPPLPQRPKETQDKGLSEPKAPAPPTPLRRFSIPLLDGCDFFEVVD